jgi:hypothetical protein
MQAIIVIGNMRTNYLDTGLPFVFRVDRASPLGNPFRMSSESQRDEVCDKYENYFRQQSGNDVNARFATALYKIVDACMIYHRVYLMCWCAPKRCHAEKIKRYLEGRL